MLNLTLKVSQLKLYFSVPPDLQVLFEDEQNASVTQTPVLAAVFAGAEQDN